MKLTQSMRDKIKNAMVKAAFSAEEELLKSMEGELFDRLVATSVGKENLEVMKKLPDNFFTSRGSLYAVCSETSSAYYYLMNQNGTKTPAYLGNGARVIVEGELLDAVQEFKAREKDFDDRKSRFEAQTKGVLNTFSTDGALLEAWPMVREIMPIGFFEQPAKVNLPMEIISSLSMTVEAGLEALAAQ